MFTKSIIAIFAFVCFAQAISAQTVGKGAWMLGGSAGFSSTKVKGLDGSLTAILIDPTIGYFIANDLAIGTELSFFSLSSGGETNTSTGLGPFVRYYVTNPIFIQAHVSLDLSDNGQDPTYGASVGYSWFLNNGVAIEPAVFFNTGNSTTEFGLSIGIQAFVNHDHGME
ncbi:MAG: hypothetical protein IPP15_15050 [Saprospiraceae bacterium]|uniref:Outer membrane protein beta-barrel domain-containing protein n=1 Tax=Candidatus Opimibacter skivensis TaxID=2982028 RepID=A0A9D7SZI6_9BACT|nr:hypothetical protein [Candidatus Opimibacter skivensis]